MYKASGSQGNFRTVYVRRVRTLIGSLFVATLLCADALGQQPRTYPPFTLVTRYTEYDSKGEILRVSAYTSYHSSTGDWRSVGKFAGVEYATLYRRGRGVYQSNSRTSRLIKQSHHAPGCPLRTAEELRADQKFTRTEKILGFTAYVLTDTPNEDFVMEHYYVPELGGGTPVKSVTTIKNGLKVISEPVSVRLEEPDVSDVTGPDYLVIEQEPRFIKNISEQLLAKPEPDYPAEALARGQSGYVNVSVVVDESGTVISAGAKEGGAPQLLREAAVEAAYKASFKPMIAEGRAFVFTGIINYWFVLPR
jgi:protein TonB